MATWPIQSAKARREPSSAGGASGRSAGSGPRSSAGSAVAGGRPGRLADRRPGRSPSAARPGTGPARDTGKADRPCQGWTPRPALAERGAGLVHQPAEAERRVESADSQPRRLMGARPRPPPRSPPIARPSGSAAASCWNRGIPYTSAEFGWSQGNPRSVDSLAVSEAPGTQMNVGTSRPDRKPAPARLPTHPPRMMKSSA